MFATCEEENQLFKSGHKYIAGADEVGRGSLAGPAAIAVVVFDKVGFEKISKLKIKDSKHLTEKGRNKFFKIIKNFAHEIKYINVPVSLIDKINISKAVNSSLAKAVNSLKTKPSFLLLDGGLTYKFPISNFQFPKKRLKIKQKTIIKGDEKCFIIAAASIIAKVNRDGLMRRLAKKYPRYKFEKNKAYGTELHIEMIKKYGPSKIHRKTFLKNLQAK